MFHLESPTTTPPANSPTPSPRCCRAGSLTPHGARPDARPVHASLIVARDSQALVAVLHDTGNSVHAGHLFLPGGRREQGEDAEACAHRELKEEAGATARRMRPLGEYAITSESGAHLSLSLAQDLRLGPQELTDTEAGFKLEWWTWTMDDALKAAEEGQFLLPASPRLFLAERLLNAR
ncbi:NUDIX hydrolase [Streptomyces sp. NPDC053427]|uniref:NUDIX hydrolase n=1 Tax=Streptomyces sp. NPDC053427 TaxID=3365701 RepID=UPI0037D7732A